MLIEILWYFCLWQFHVILQTSVYLIVQKQDFKWRFFSAKICKKSKGAPLPKILTAIYHIFTIYCCYPAYHCMLSVVYMLKGAYGLLH